MPYIGGVLNMTGARPGQAFSFPGPAFPRQVCYIIKFTSTYEAIEKYILPPPLKVDRNLPPEVIVWYFSSPESKGPDGSPAPYQGFQFRGNTEVDGVKGMAGWEYIDGLRGDKTEMDVMLSWAVHYGMAKKFADIRFTAVSGDEFEITVDRQATRLVTMRLRLGQEIDGDVLKGLAESADSPLAKDTFTVREMPNSDFSGYSERTVCTAPTGRSCNVTQAWSADRGSIEFGHLESDPLSELEPQEVTLTMVANIQVQKETFTELKVVSVVE
ncbi:hypothetical protein AK830_g4040 [Neonectria ditissima]|uniref:Uncharacterized protein n=1 Tax=Neonectria ditissima TaxID=78410 RepID=A0A0P7BGU1_9HYPO|nr:hypothetical protein AK830_g4040 [Neonectria ditissima]